MALCGGNARGPGYDCDCSDGNYEMDIQERQMIRPKIPELTANIQSLIRDKYMLRSALENCIRHMQENGGVIRHPVLKEARKAIKETTFASLRGG